MEKKSQLCVGLDLRVPIDERVNAALDIIDQTHDLVVAYKPNRNFWLGSSIEDIQEVNSRMDKHGVYSICDHKITDIGSTNENAIHTMKLEGFHFYTASPFPGNLQSNYEISEPLGIGQIALVLMSNPESSWMITTEIYKVWAQQANLYADGVVIGATDHIAQDVLNELADILSAPFVLAPGLGSQGGKPENLIEFFGQRVIFNVSRGVTLSKDPRTAAEEYLHKIYALANLSK